MKATFPELKEFIDESTLKLIYPTIQKAYRDITKILDESGNHNICSVMIQAPIGAGKTTLCQLLSIGSYIRLHRYWKASDLEFHKSLGLLRDSKLLHVHNYHHKDIFSSLDLKLDASLALTSVIPKMDDNVFMKKSNMVGGAVIGGCVSLQNANDYENYSHALRRIRSRFNSESYLPSPVIAVENWYSKDLRNVDLVYELSLDQRRSKSYLEMAIKDYKKYFTRVHTENSRMKKPLFISQLRRHFDPS
ncbi:hypothetical protein [Vibrio phage Va2]|nr:hypothetical protein [Vibrio phage Va2]